MKKYIGISSPLNIVLGKHPNLDVRYGPYDNISEALSNIPEEVRSLGLTVGIFFIEDGIKTIREYWWRKGIEDNFLEPKIFSSEIPSEKEVIGIPYIGNSEVAYGTLEDNLNLPSRVEVTLSDNTSILMPINWGISIPTYNSNSPGNYVYTGNLIATGNISNPNNLTTTFTVTVLAQDSDTPKEWEEPIPDPNAIYPENPKYQPFIDMHQNDKMGNLIGNSFFTTRQLWREENDWSSRIGENEMMLATNRTSNTRSAVYQYIDCVIGQTYHHSVYMKSTSNGTMRLELEGTSYNNDTGNTRVVGVLNDYRFYETTFVANQTNVKVTYSIDNPDSGLGFLKNPTIVEGSEYIGSRFRTLVELKMQARYLYPRLNLGTNNWGNRTYTPSGPISYYGRDNLIIENLIFQDFTGIAIQFNNCSNVTIRNCKFLNIRTMTENTIKVIQSSNILFSHNIIENCSRGIQFWECTGGIKVEWNDILNIRGKLDNGGSIYAQGIQLARCTGGGNHVINNSIENIQGKSGQEDAINLWASHGTALSPIRVANNYIRGGGQSMNGGSVVLGDGGEGTYQINENNISVNGGAYAFTIASGQHMIMRNNKAYMEPGIMNANVGLSIWFWQGEPGWNPNALEDIICENNEILWYSTRGGGTIHNYFIDTDVEIQGWDTNIFSDTTLTNLDILPDTILTRAFSPYIEQPPLNIIEVTTINNLTIPNGAERPGLPLTVEVTLEDGTTTRLNVNWGTSVPAFDTNIPGNYTYTGTLVLNSGTTNTSNLTAQVTVEVYYYKAPENRQEFLDLYTPTLGNNLLLDPMFRKFKVEGETSPWSSWNEWWLTAENGIISADASQIYTTLIQYVENLTIGQQYTLSFRMRTDNIGPGNVTMHIPYSLPSASQPLATGTTPWRDYTITFTQNGSTGNEILFNRPDVETGFYHIEKPMLNVGAVALPFAFNNMAELTAEAEIRFPDPVNISSVSALNNINVANGTVSPTLPTNVTVVLENLLEESVEIIWGASTPEYNGSVAGTYIYTGDLILPEWILNPNNLKASVSVIVASGNRIVTSVATPVPNLIEVPFGTLEADIPYPTSLTVTFDDRSVEELIPFWYPWPAYDGNVAQDYYVSGQPGMLEGMSNPNSLGGDVTVRVLPQ